MVVHPAAGHSSGTLVNALLHHVDDLSGVGGELRPGIVHRLDRGTSGVMVVAKNDASHQELARQFHDREVEKEYVALVWGTVHAGQAHRRADRPRPGRPAEDVHPGAAGAQRRDAGDAGRASARRHALQVAIATGRTHQIRVHLNAIGHPIVGDPTYGGVRRRVPHDVRAVQRLERRSCTRGGSRSRIPPTARRLEFESPLPADLQAVIDAIREKQSDTIDHSE